MSRFKQSGSVDPVMGTYSYTNYINGSPSSSGQAQKESSYQYSYMLGRDIPNFHKRKKRGDLLPHTEFEQFESTASASTDVHLTYYGKTNLVGSGPTFQNADFIVFPGELSRIASEEMSTAYVTKAAARGVSSQWDALTFAAELGKTIQMFRTAVKRFNKLADKGIERSILDGGPSGWANLWMEYRYGWRVLWYDLVSIAEAIEKMDRSAKVRSFTSGHTKTDSRTRIVRTLNWSSMDLSIEQSDRLVIGQRGVVSLKTSLERIEANFVNTAWELVTFSFLIDRLIDIGSYLRSLHYLVGNIDYSASAGVSIELERETVSIPSFKGAYAGTYNQRGTCTAKMVTRTPTSIPYHPQFELDMDAGLFTDILALLSLALTKKLGLNRPIWR